MRIEPNQGQLARIPPEMMEKWQRIGNKVLGLLGQEMDDAFEAYLFFRWLAKIYERGVGMEETEVVTWEIVTRSPQTRGCSK